MVRDTEAMNREWIFICAGCGAVLDAHEVDGDIHVVAVTDRDGHLIPQACGPVCNVAGAELEGNDDGRVDG